MAWGVTSTGFNRKRLPDIKIDLTNLLKGIFGDINTDDASVFGQFIGVMSKIIADSWETAEDTYNSAYPSSASGVPLDSAVSLNAVERLPQTRTIVTCQLTGVNGTTVPINSQIQNTNGNVYFLYEEVIIGSGSTDGIFYSVEYGPIPAVAGTLIEILTPVAGWNAITNTTDGQPGRFAETDAELRQRRLSDVSVIGAGTDEAIAAHLRQEVYGVSAAAVFSNREDVLDVHGRPPHSLEAVVSGGLDAAIAKKIWLTSPSGIQFYGSESVTIVDSNGDNQIIKFSRPTIKYAWVEITITSYTSEEVFPVGGQETIRQAIVDYGTVFTMGKDLFIDRWRIPVYTSVTGVINMSIRQSVTDLPGDSPIWQTGDISIGPTAIAAMDLNRVVVYT